MKILKSAIVSNSDIIKNFKTQRERAESLGKIFVFKNNQPDSVLFSISEYERVSEVLEAMEVLNNNDLSAIVDFINNKKRNSFISADTSSLI